MMVVEEMAIVLPMAEAPWDLCCRPGPAVSIPGPRPIDLAGRAGARRSARRTRLGAAGALNSRWEPLPETAGRARVRDSDGCRSRRRRRRRGTILG